MDPGKWNQSQNDSMAESSVLYNGIESEQERHSQCDNKEKEYIQSHVAQRRKSITGILTGLHSSFDMADVEITPFKIDSLVASETFIKTDKSIFSEVDNLKKNDESDASKETVPDQTLTTPNSSTTSSDVKADGNGDTTTDAIQENRVNLTRTPSKRKVFVKARLLGDNAIVDKAQRETTPLENERSQTSLGMVGSEDHERSIQENINQSKSRSYTPGLPPIPRSKTSSTSRRNMKRIQVSPRVDLLMNSDLFRRNLERHTDLLNRVGYSFGMKKSVSNLDLSLPFDHDGKSHSENVKSLNLARGTSNLDQAWTNSRRDENCSDNTPSSEISCANSTKNRNKEVNTHRNPALKTSSRRYSLAMEADSSFDIYKQISHPPSVMDRNCIPSFDEFKRQRKQKLLNNSDTAVLNPKSPATLKNEISNLVFDFEHSLKHISEEANRVNKENANGNSTHEIVQLHTSGLHSKANRRLQFANSSKKRKQTVNSQQNDESLGNENKVKFKSKISQNSTLEEFNRLTEESVNDISAIISSSKQIIRENSKETDSVISEQHFNIDAENKTCDGYSLGTEHKTCDGFSLGTEHKTCDGYSLGTEHKTCDGYSLGTEHKTCDGYSLGTEHKTCDGYSLGTEHKTCDGYSLGTEHKTCDGYYLGTEHKTCDGYSLGTEERREPDIRKTDTSFKRPETDFIEIDSSFKRQVTDFIETDSSFKRQETDFIETDPSFKRQETDFIETDPSFKSQVTDFIETDSSFKRQETDFIETDPSFERQETDFIETDPSFERQENDLTETDTSFERQENDFIDMNTSFAESANISLPISKNALKSKSESCTSHKHEKHSNSIKKKLLSVISIGSGKKKNESVNNAKTCQNSSVQESVDNQTCKGNNSSLMDNQTEVNKYIYSSSTSTSQKQRTLICNDPCKGNNSSLMDNKTEYRGSNSSMTEDGSEVFFLTRQESITSSIQSIPDSLNAENVDKFQEFDDYEYEDRKFSMKGLRDNVSPVLRSTSDACNATAEAVQKRRERKERPYKSDPFTGLENLPAPGLRHHRSFASSSREEILSFLGNATIHSRFTHHDSSPSLEELHEDDDEDESLPETAFEKERKGRNRLSSASMTSTDSGVIGQDSQISPTSTLSVTHTSTWPDFQSHDLLSHDTTSIVRSQSEMSAHQKLIKCADCGQDKKPANLDINLNTSHKDRLCKQCYQRRIERKETIQEISDTEISYGRDLMILKNEFYNPMKTAGLLKPEQLDSIFLNLDELIHVNTQFTTKLQAAVEEANQTEDVDLQFINIGSLFLESSTMFLTFENYCVNQEQAPRLLEQYEKEKELLRIFLDVSQNENILLRRMHLKSFLMVPVQRIMKYPLLLDRLYKATPPSHNDKEGIREAKDKIEDILGHINAKTKSISGGILKLGQKGRSSLKHYSLTEKMEISRVALEVLGWNRKDVCEIITSRLKMTQAQDHTWASKKCKNLKFSSVHGILFTLGEQSSNDNNCKKNLMFPRKSPVKQAAVVLIKEKNGKYQALREPLMLEKCIVTVDPDYDEVFELLEWNKDPYLIKAGTPKETNMWSQHLKQLIQDLGRWRRRRNALPNILLHIHPE